MYKKIPIILDGDPGHDDAIAWVLARANKNIDILAVTTVAGNQTIEKTTYNARRICTLLGIDAPIGMGVERPLLRNPMTAQSVHGVSGLDGPELPEPTMDVSELGAVDLIAKKVIESEEKVTLVPTGPLTNIATFLLAYPELKSKIERISMMGGGISHGNWSPAAEFNILVDPEAADIVFRSGIKITMAGLDVTEKALIYKDDIERVRSRGTNVSNIVAEWLEFFSKFHLNLGYEGAPLHDPVAVVALTNEEILDINPMYVEIETKGRYCQGATIGDLRGFTGKKPNVDVIMGINREKFVDLIVEAVSTYKEN